MKLFFYIYLLIFLLSCKIGNYTAGEIKVKGSDTMVWLMDELAKEYMKTHTGVSVQVSGGGSGTGFKALYSGTVDICSSSREIEPDEAKNLAENYRALGLSFIIGKDALSIFVNRQNPINDFSLQQIKDIFTCKINNWSELGWKDLPIMRIIRPPNSGTHLYFRQHVLKSEPYCDSSIIIPTTKSIVKKVEDTQGAIGYGGIGYSGEIVPASIEGIEPTEENVIDDQYPISRYLYLYTVNSPEGIIKNFIDWVLSPDGQQVVKRMGYIPVWKIRY